MYLATCKPVYGDSVFWGDGSFHRPIKSMTHAEDLVSTGSVWRAFTDEVTMWETIGPVPLSTITDIKNLIGDIQVSGGADAATIAKAVADEEGRRMSQSSSA